MFKPDSVLINVLNGTLMKLFSFLFHVFNVQKKKTIRGDFALLQRKVVTPQSEILTYWSYLISILTILLQHQMGFKIVLTEWDFFHQ